MVRVREIGPGELFKKVGHGQPLWQVDSLIRHANHPHAKLKRIDSPATQNDDRCRRAQRPALLRACGGR
jgi:hypothetical protein